MSDETITIQRLEALNDEGLLENLPRLREELAMRREFASAMQELRSPKRAKAMHVTELADVPTPGADELGICVIDGELSSVLERTPVVIGESGHGPTATRWVWDPVYGNAIGFISRATFAGLRRERLGDRLIVLDPGKGRGASFADLFELVAASPSRVRHIHDLAKNICRGTRTLRLLELWAAHPSTRRDPQRYRIVMSQLELAQKESAAEIT